MMDSFIEAHSSLYFGGQLSAWPCLGQYFTHTPEERMVLVYPCSFVKKIFG
jgi:hypothetical protein